MVHMNRTVRRCINLKQREKLKQRESSKIQRDYYTTGISLYYIVVVLYFSSIIHREQIKIQRKKIKIHRKSFENRVYVVFFNFPVVFFDVFVV